MSQHDPADPTMQQADVARDDSFPSDLPRPEGELEELKRVWRRPTGWRFLTVVNNSYIGIFYLGAALLFFLLAGLLALIMRAQLAFAENDLISQDTYNQVFTMHGTIMMFLFAVPAVEAFGIYLLPNMQAARDLPFPRLSAYAFWAYFVGGLVFFCSLFFDLAPKGGWFMYPPLTSYQFSPGHNADFWLLGIGFIEISAIAGAIEIVVGVLKTRAPGMSLDKLPIYAWAMLVFAAMIVFGFPAIILGTALLEIERSFQWPFFIAEKGGDPLLWQHLFWFFGHPEVYIIFLPAAGFVSMIVPTMAQTPLVGYRFVVLALLTTGFIAFGVWVHHMFATGIPQLSISFFSAASMAVSIPAGIQLFAWIATIAKGRLVLNTPSYFVLGFLAIFTIGGLTGIMVGVVPFDWQVHDTYFVVAHFHYVLIGGMVFPLFAAFYYWAPVASARPLSEGVGRWVFWLMFVGFNLTFFPMHITGLLGMPRRVWTYPSELGWEWLNLTSTAGAFLLAAGVLLFLIDVVRRFRPFGEEDAGNVWNAGTLEWLPAGDHANRSIPIIKSREPLWDDPTLAQNVEAGRYYLAGTQTGGRETIVTTPIEARPQYVLQMPGPSLPTVLAAIFTAAFFLLLTVKMVIPAVACGIVAVACIVWWMWDSDPGPNHPSVDVGGGLILPVYMTGPASHAYWAMIVVMLVAGSTFAALVFSYFFLWTVSPDVWPAATGQRIPSLLWPLAGAGLLLASTALVRAGDPLLARSARLGQWPTRGVLLLAIPLLFGGLAVELYGQSQVGLRPEDSGYAAVVYMTSALQGVFVAVVSIMGLFTIARSLAGRLDAERRGTYENMLLLWYYTAGQGLVGLAMVHLAPRLLG